MRRDAAFVRRVLDALARAAPPPAARGRGRLLGRSKPITRSLAPRGPAAQGGSRPATRFTLLGLQEQALEEPVACLVGTILSQATNDALAERAYRALRRRFPSWRQVLAAPCAEVEDAIRVAGLAAQKARAIQACLSHLVATRGRISLADLRRSDLDVDAALAELSSIPGVGVKTAAITLMFGAGVQLCAVDTHLARILRRLAIVPDTSGPERAFRLLRPLVPDGRAIELHLRLIRHGRTICRARKPRCDACPLARVCPTGRATIGRAVVS